MLNLVKAELYKYKRRPVMYVICGIILFFMCSYIIMIKNYFMPEYAVRESLVETAGITLPAILLFMVGFVSNFTEEYKDNTFKNLVTSNVSRSKIYLGKFISQVLLAIIMAVICIGVFLIMINIVDAGPNYTIGLLNEFLIRFMVSIPIFIAGIALVDVCAVIFKKELFSVIAVYIVLQGVPMAINLLGMFVSEKFYKVTPFLVQSPLEGFDLVNECVMRDYVWAIAVGVVYTMIFLVLGTSIFKRQNI